jgi:peptidoglycan/xylan/chitin deacetylase (PgdA/CDA1 family)
MYQKYNNNKLEKDKIVENYKEIMNNKEIDDEKIKEINGKIDELNNIGDKIKSTREEVYKLSSELEKKIKSGESKKKIAYLTFDDGPYYNTYKVLKILKQNKVKATFFTTNTNGEHCYDNKNANCHEVYAAIAKDNHTLANHTYTHGWNRGLYNSTSSFMDAIKKQENLIKEKTGVTTNIARFPGGSSTPGATKGKAMKEALYKAGYGWVDWTASDGDGGSLPNYATGMKNFKGTIGDKIEVVLFHDYHQVTTAMLPEVIKYLRDKNYIILPLFYESVMIHKG